MSLTRIAPTPSGYLHAGNIRNIEITVDLARREGLALALRIDDCDASRYRREYVEGIFESLRALGITWDIGPRDPEDFETRWSQRARTDYYRSQLAAASSLDTYACTCSRSMAAALGTGGCTGGCRGKGTPLTPNASALRVHVPEGTIIDVDGVDVDLATAMGDFVIWRRDDLPAYQLVSVIEDRDLGTTHIVRGEDLLASSAAQILLARHLGAPNVVDATYIHHPLLVDSLGRKLSKSQTA